jgi:hypothetical protein
VTAGHSALRTCSCLDCGAVCAKDVLVL